MKKVMFYILLASVLVACKKPQKKNFKELIIGDWKSLNPKTFGDMSIKDTLRFDLVLRSDERNDSIGFLYRINRDTFFIDTHAFNASENKILTLNQDTFIFARPADLDTFRFVRAH
ncbi:MAG: hypothetical protein EOO42_00925 [Flavobacteriales bacterium]|nr:MAG: hypothetical protein EOO42_00925 [Flavobacteriales bacterium]